MLAFRFVEWGHPGEYREVPVPQPGPGQALVRVAGSGLCGTDIGLLRSGHRTWPDPPYTVGHETAGWIEKLGDGVSDWTVGDGVLVSALPWCGSCRKCQIELENECRSRPAAYGLGRDGGLAAYMVADTRDLVSLGSLDPRTAVPLADAGSTSYRAVRLALEPMRGGNIVVIGVGGLGEFAVQYLRALSDANVVALDVRQRALERAAELGAAHTFLAGVDSAVAVHAASPGGVDAVIDFVGVNNSLRLASEVIGSGGRIVQVGIGGGRLSVGWEVLPRSAQYVTTSGWRLKDMREAVALAQSGRITLTSEHIPFRDIHEGIDQLQRGAFRGRVVVDSLAH
nr:alcohol dehydrogenase catalytic domain-containing protein [Rhodococcus sp. 14C212]